MDAPSIVTFLVKYWKIILMFSFVCNAISAMPSPNGSGATNTWWYKWIFGFLHSWMNMVRVLVTIFPDNPVSKVMNKTNGSSN